MDTYIFPPQYKSTLVILGEICSSKSSISSSSCFESTGAFVHAISSVSSLSSFGVGVGAFIVSNDEPCSTTFTFKLIVFMQFPFEKINFTSLLPGTIPFKLPSFVISTTSSFAISHFTAISSGTSLKIFFLLPSYKEIFSSKSLSDNWFKNSVPSSSTI